jgi:bacterioferritin
MADAAHKIVDELIRSYWMEMETVQNYLANSQNLDGVRAAEIKKSLAADITEELGHAQMLAGRIRVLGGTVPGSMKFKAEQKSLQPPADSTDVVTVIRGVIEAENGAIEQYQKLIKLCDGTDYATQDMVIGLLADEQNHRREFIGFLAEYEKRTAADKAHTAPIME